MYFNLYFKVNDRDAVHLLSEFIEVFLWAQLIIISDFGGKEKFSCLSIIVTLLNFEQLLDSPRIPSNTGLEMSSAIFDNLEKWSLIDKVQGFVFDTTSSNTGRLN